MAGFFSPVHFAHGLAHDSRTQASTKRGRKKTGSEKPVFCWRRENRAAGALCVQAAVFGRADREVHTLDRRARGALAQIVEARDRDELLVVAEHEQVDAIAVVVRLHVEHAAVEILIGVERHHAHEALARVVLAVQREHVLRRGAARELLRRKIGRDREALVERADDRREHGRLLEAAVERHFRQMLVREAERVRARAHQLRIAACFVLRNHLLAAAAVAGERVAVRRETGRDQTGLDERAHRQHECRSVAAGDRDALRRAHFLALRAGQFRQAVSPVGVGAKGRARVDQHRAVVLDQRSRFARGHVRQAQEGHIRCVDETTAFLDVLPLGLVDPQDLDVGALRQVFENLQAGRAFLSVDKNFRAHLALSETRGLRAPPAAQRESLRAHRWGAGTVF
ncbi:hypothetical protein PT2222_200027 [Paraburkholderia tropica]